MSSPTLNSLATASSSYLRSAMHQPVRWHEWGEEAFVLAKRENKPILLDIGAVWCHWCHVMDRESYEDQEGVRGDEVVEVKITVPMPCMVCCGGESLAGQGARATQPQPHK
jgi:uncharacterized protein